MIVGSPMLFVQQLEVSGLMRADSCEEHLYAVDARQVCFNKHKQHLIYTFVEIVKLLSGFRLKHVLLGPEFTHSDLMQL